jgi:acetoacetyl-CoA reductase
MGDMLKDKVALVTGGTGGIGAAILRRFAEEGAKVATNYRNEEKAKAWLDDMTKAGFTARAYHVDVTDYPGCQKLIEDIENELGPIDILVNNAGITQDTTLRKMTKEQWDAVLGVNLDGIFNITRPLVPRMLERGRGRIINISSINAQKGQIGQTNYAAAKAGMHGFTMALAQEVARKGITVNTVSPGYVATEMVLAVPEDIRKQIIAQIPVGRLGEPEEIAELALYLASDKASFITGADFAINGGQHMM